jgi:hypothetical protein
MKRAIAFGVGERISSLCLIHAFTRSLLRNGGGELPFGELGLLTLNVRRLL